MHKDNRKDIQNEVEYTFISLFSKKLKIGVIGGGRAGSIKIKHFVNNKCYVEVLAKEFSPDILELSANNDNLKLIYREFDYEFLKDKHIVVIALDNSIIKENVKKYCDENYKIYIDSTDFKQGMAVVPTERSTRTMNIALNTKGGNPKGSVWAADKIRRILMEYDDYIDFTTKVRNTAKNIPEWKCEILKYIFTDEFKEFFDNGKGLECMKSRFPEDVIDKLNLEDIFNG